MSPQTDSRDNRALGDVLLAALSDLGDTSWERFVSISEVLGVKYPSKFRRSLDRLGHLELLSKERRQLSCAPAGLVEAAPDPKAVSGVEAFLAGRRDEILIQRVTETARLLGIQLEDTAQPPFSTRLSLRGEDRLVLIRLAELCDIQWFGAAALGLARCLTRLTPGTRAVAVGLRDCRWFSLDDAKFKGAERPARAGLAEIQGAFGPRRYILVAGDAGLEVERNVGIHMLCRLLDHATFKVSADILRVPADFPLPRLHERAVVLCSGKEPSRDGGETVYARVPGTIVSMVQSSLRPPSEMR